MYISLQNVIFPGPRIKMVTSISTFTIELQLRVQDLTLKGGGVNYSTGSVGR